MSQTDLRSSPDSSLPRLESDTGKRSKPCPPPGHAVASPPAKRRSGGVDRAIRVSTAIVVLAVAGVAAYISYWHAYAVVREYGENGVTALLEPATIDGLVYASSMVILYAARHRLPVPGLARWMLALGIAASLAVNVAQGWSHGVVGAVVAAWPALALIGSYELLAWMIRTAAGREADHQPKADQRVPPADQPEFRCEPAATLPDESSRAAPPKYGVSRLSEDASGADHVLRPVALVRGPGRNGPEATQMGKPGCGVPDRVDHASGPQVPDRVVSGGGSANHAAVAAYRASVLAGKPLSERRLAEAFGTNSRRWARHRMAEARQAGLQA
jgi:hypothetical protein